MTRLHVAGIVFQPTAHLRSSKQRTRNASLHRVWTPEHFFSSAVATCFITTFQAIAAYSKFEAHALEVSVEGQVEKTEGGFRFTRVTIRPLLAINGESDRERGLRLLEKAEKACLVSRSLQSQIILEPQVVLAPAATPV